MSTSETTELEVAFRSLLDRIEKADMKYRPTQQEKLKMYALYKQITEGDVTGERPGMTNFVARAKYTAWERCKGMSKEAGMQAYLDLFADKS